MSDNVAAVASNSSKSNDNSIKTRCLVQQCLNARLKVNLDENAENSHVEISRGAVFFICFFKGAEESDVDKLVKSLINVKLSETDDENHVSIIDLPGDVLVIPQATLGGKMKGKAIQYHNNIEKEKGKQLYEKFIQLLESNLKSSSKWFENNCKLKYGTYGIRQVYSTQTNGPYLHIIDI